MDQNQPQIQPHQAYDVDSTSPKHSNLKLALIAIGSAVIALGLILVLLLFIFQDNTDQSGSKSEEFVSHILNEDYSAAYSMLASDIKSRQSVEEFASGIEPYGLDSSCNLSISGRETNTGDNGSVIETIGGGIVCDEKTFPLLLQITNSEEITLYNIRPGR